MTTVLLSFYIWRKLESWKSSKLGASRADWKIKISSSWSIIFFYSAQQWTISWSECGVWWKVDSIWQLAMARSVVGPRRSNKAVLQLNLHQSSWSLWWSVAGLITTAFWIPVKQNHYIWEVCSANQWDVPKPAMSVAGIGQQKGPSFS